jgi:hypothetical protein
MIVNPLSACSGVPSHLSRTRAGVRASLSAVLLIAAAPLLGCATGDGPGMPDDVPETGQLVVQLTQPGPHGEIFHLNHAIFDIVPANGIPLTVEGSGSDTQVVVELDPGIATVQLRAGWRLEKSSDGGATFEPVGALLGSLNPNTVRILANQPSFVGFDFLVREHNGTLAITLGIVAAPRELAGGFIVSTATGDLANYALAMNRLLDFAVFFNLATLESVILEDGSKARIYTAFGQQGSLGPVPLPTQAVAAEFYNDKIGTLQGPIADGLHAALLQYTVAAKPDGTVELSGQLSGISGLIEFGPHPIDAIVPTLDADGFPNDEFFYDATQPFTLTTPTGSIAGTLRMRHIPSPP